MAKLFSLNNVFGKRWNSFYILLSLLSLLLLLLLSLLLLYLIFSIFFFFLLWKKFFFCRSHLHHRTFQQLMKKMILNFFSVWVLDPQWPSHGPLRPERVCQPGSVHRERAVDARWRCDAGRETLLRLLSWRAVLRHSAHHYHH